MRLLASYGAAAAADRLASMYDMCMHVRGLGSAERAVLKHNRKLKTLKS